MPKTEKTASEIIQEQSVTKIPPALGSGKLLLAQHDHNTYSVNIPHGVSPGDVLAKTFWRHHAANLRPKDVIRAFCEDGTWEMWLTVIKPEPPSSVYVSELFRASHSNVETVEIDDLKIAWISPPLQFCIIRTSTGERIRERLYPRAVAEAELSRLKPKAA